MGVLPQHTGQGPTASRSRPVVRSPLSSCVRSMSGLPLFKHVARFQVSDCSGLADHGKRAGASLRFAPAGKVLLFPTLCNKSSRCFVLTHSQHPSLNEASLGRSRACAMSASTAKSEGTSSCSAQRGYRKRRGDEDQVRRGEHADRVGEEGGRQELG